MIYTSVIANITHLAYFFANSPKNEAIPFIIASAVFTNPSRALLTPSAHLPKMLVKVRIVITTKSTGIT